MVVSLTDVLHRILPLNLCHDHVGGDQRLAPYGNSTLLRSSMSTLLNVIHSVSTRVRWTRYFSLESFGPGASTATPGIKILATVVSPTTPLIHVYSHSHCYWSHWPRDYRILPSPQSLSQSRRGSYQSRLRCVRVRRCPCHSGSMVRPRISTSARTRCDRKGHRSRLERLVVPRRGHGWRLHAAWWRSWYSGIHSGTGSPGSQGELRPSLVAGLLFNPHLCFRSQTAFDKKT